MPVIDTAPCASAKRPVPPEVLLVHQNEVCQYSMVEVECRVNLHRPRQSPVRCRSIGVLEQWAERPVSLSEWVPTAIAGDFRGAVAGTSVLQGRRRGYRSRP